MSYEIRVAETDHGDGFGPEPGITITAKGTDDVARLVHLLARGLTEQIIVAADIVKKLRRNKGGRAALKLLAKIGGPDFTTHLPGQFDPAKAAESKPVRQWAVRHPEVQLAVHRSRSSALYTRSKLPGGVLVTRMSNEGDDAWVPVPTFSSAQMLDEAKTGLTDEQWRALQPSNQIARISSARARLEANGAVLADDEKSTEVPA